MASLPKVLLLQQHSGFSPAFLLTKGTLLPSFSKLKGSHFHRLLPACLLLRDGWPVPEAKEVVAAHEKDRVDYALVIPPPIPTSLKHDRTAGWSARNMGGTCLRLRCPGNAANPRRHHRPHRLFFNRDRL